jgi:hypothetical protein
MKRIKNLPLLIALVLIGVAGFGFFSIIQSLRNDVTILVAKDNLAAYTYVEKGKDFNTLDVPEAVVTADMLTEEEYNSLFVDENGDDRGTVLTYPFLRDQWIIEQGLSKEPENTFAVVLPDERVASVTTNVTGAGLGTIKPGDVVTVSGSDSGFGDSFPAVDFAKVLCITTQPDGCSNVLPSDGAETNQDSAVSQTSQEGPFFLLLAVPKNVASSVSGKEVALTQDPFCRVGPKGMFIGDNCDAKSSGRDAASELRQEDRQSGVTGATGATGVTGPAEGA